MDRREIPHDPHHLGVASDVSKTISKPMVHSTQTMHLSWVKICTISKWAQHSLEPRHLRVPSGASKTISELMVCFVQTVHLSCTNTNMVTKLKEVRFHMNHVTLEFHRMRLKWCPSIWYIRRKPCTYLGSRLALSPKGRKRASTWTSSPSGTIRRV
jgi:hypothetical protein